MRLKPVPFFTVAFRSEIRVVFIVQTELAAYALSTALTGWGCPNTVELVNGEYDRLNGQRVAILPANNEAGKRVSQVIAMSLDGIAQAIKIVDLPDIPEGAGVEEWIIQGGTSSSLASVVENAPVCTPGAAKVRGSVADAEDFLSSFLVDGPMPALDVRTAAEAMGISYGTLRRAADRLGVSRRKAGGRFGGDPRWYWHL